MLTFQYKADYDDDSLLYVNPEYTRNSNEEFSTTQENNITNSITLTRARVNDSPVSPVSRKRKRKMCELISETFSHKQLEYIKNVLFEEEMLLHEMDEVTM